MFVGVVRALLRERFNEAAGGGRGVEKQDAAGFFACIFPALLNSEWVGYPAYGLSEVKSSFPAIRKITVRMVAKRV